MGFCIIKTTIPNSCNQKNQTLNLPLWWQPNVSIFFMYTVHWSLLYVKQNKNPDL